MTTNQLYLKSSDYLKVSKQIHRLILILNFPFRFPILTPHYSSSLLSLKLWVNTEFYFSPAPSNSMFSTFPLHLRTTILIKAAKIPSPSNLDFCLCLQVWLPTLFIFYIKQLLSYYVFLLLVSYSLVYLSPNATTHLLRFQQSVPPQSNFISHFSKTDFQLICIPSMITVPVYGLIATKMCAVPTSAFRNTLLIIWGPTQNSQASWPELYCLLSSLF